MSRYGQQTSYGHRVQTFGWGYRLSWTVDRYSPHSRLRFPTRYTRDTDLAGAQRFAKKWNLPEPQDKAT